MEILSEIADKIKELRKEKGYTLKDLADKTELSVSFLSQVENGSSSLAITSLKKLADAFSVPMTFFFYSMETHNYHVKIDEQKSFKMEGLPSEFVRLSGDFSGRSLESMIVTIPGGQKHGHKYNHPGEEFAYVLEGVLIVEIEDKEYLVQAGDSIHYPSTMPHQWRNPLGSPVKILSVITPAVF